MRKSIGIDLDSTLNCLVEYWLEVYNIEYDDCLTPEDITGWDMQQFVKESCGPKIYDYILRPGTFTNLMVQSYSQKVTKFLSQYYDLYIVTAYHWKNCADKAQWIIEHFSHIDSDRIIFCNNKGLICTDYLIDDGPHNLEAFKGNGILFDAPWNRFLGDKFLRVKNWLEVESYFKAILSNTK